MFLVNLEYLVALSKYGMDIGQQDRIVVLGLSVNTMEMVKLHPQEGSSCRHPQRMELGNTGQLNSKHIRIKNKTGHIPVLFIIHPNI